MGFLNTLRRKGDDADDDFDLACERPEGIAEASRRDYSNEPIRADPKGYFYGPLAQGLALSAPMVISNGAAWNSPTDIGRARAQRTLSDSWGIENAADWMSVLKRLVDAECGNSVAYHATNVRQAVKNDRDLPMLADADWAAALRAEAARLDAPDSYADALCESIADIRAAEDTLRRCHLLGADEEVESLDGYDWLRAGNVVRWGVAVGYGDPHFASDVPMLCRDAASTRYSSWRAYSLGLNVGRIVTFPKTFGRHHVCAIEMIRPFLDSAESPWNHLPFPAEKVLDDAE